MAHMIVAWDGVGVAINWQLVSSTGLSMLSDTTNSLRYATSPRVPRSAANLTSGCAAALSFSCAQVQLRRVNVSLSLSPPPNGGAATPCPARCKMQGLEGVGGWLRMWVQVGQMVQDVFLPLPQRLTRWCRAPHRPVRRWPHW